MSISLFCYVRLVKYEEILPDPALLYFFVIAQQVCSVRWLQWQILSHFFKSSVDKSPNLFLADNHWFFLSMSWLNSLEMALKCFCLTHFKTGVLLHIPGTKSASLTSL